MASAAYHASLTANGIRCATDGAVKLSQSRRCSFSGARRIDGGLPCRRDHASPRGVAVRASVEMTEAEKEGWRKRRNEAAEEAAQKAEKEAEAAEAGAVDEWRWTLNWNHILPNLIVGSCPRSPDDVDRIADEAGATAILNLQSDLCFDALQIPFESIRARAVERGVLLARVPIRDFDHGDQAFMLPEAVRVVNVLLHRGHTVYVHCTAGINRASLTCVAYLYFVQGLRRDEAVTLVKNARPIAHPYLDCLADAKRRLLEGRQEEMTALATQIYEQRNNGGHTGSATSDWSAAQTTAIAASFRKFLEVDNGLLSMEDDLAAAAEARRQQQEEESDDERGEAVAAEIERLTGELRQQREEIQQLQAAARQWKLQKEQAEGMVQLLQQELAMKDAAAAAAAAAGAAAGGGASSLKVAGSTTNGVAVVASVEGANGVANSKPVGSAKSASGPPESLKVAEDLV